VIASNTPSTIFARATAAAARFGIAALRVGLGNEDGKHVPTQSLMHHVAFHVIAQDARRMDDIAEPLTSTESAESEGTAEQIREYRR
jgi:hypothetical protein